jgi:hypothetical protein
VVTPPIVIIFFIFAGVFINVDSLPNGSAWVAKISFLKWAYQAVMINEFAGRTYQRVNSKGVSENFTGESVLQRQGFDKESIEDCILYLFFI